jgi:hypothetical protein
MTKTNKKLTYLEKVKRSRNGRKFNSETKSSMGMYGLGFRKVYYQTPRKMVRPE